MRHYAIHRIRNLLVTYGVTQSTSNKGNCYDNAVAESFFSTYKNIDFFSRYIISYGISPSVNASHVKHIYAMGLKDQGIRKNKDILPELRVDRGSPNTSLITKEFFDIMGADLSFARVRRPTDNALTERFFGTAKQEEIYMVGSYPDERSAWEEIGSYIYRYNHERPHQNLWNFTPAHIHEVNNNTLILEELKELKQKSKLARRIYWEGVR